MSGWCLVRGMAACRAAAADMRTRCWVQARVPSVTPPAVTNTAPHRPLQSGDTTLLQGLKQAVDYDYVDSSHTAPNLHTTTLARILLSQCIIHKRRERQGKCSPGSSPVCTQPTMPDHHKVQDLHCDHNSRALAPAP